MKKHSILMLSLLAVAISCNKFDSMPLRIDTKSQLNNDQPTPIGNQLPIKVKTESSGSTLNALLYLPDDYYATSETARYPLILSFPGKGETGSNEADLHKMLGVGLPKVIAAGTKIEATNPTDDMLYKFIVVSPQHFSWAPSPDAVDCMLTDLGARYRIDMTRIYLTGYSAGGEGVLQAVTYTQALANRIAAVIPMSPTAPNSTYMSHFSFFAVSHVDAWFFCEDNDAQSYTASTKNFNDSINKYYPGGSKITLYPGTHCCWDKNYDPGFREAGMNIYEWMLTHKRQ